MTSAETTSAHFSHPNTLYQDWQNITEGLAEMAAQRKCPRYGINRSWWAESSEWPPENPDTRYLHVSHVVNSPKTRGEILDLRWKDEYYHDIMDVLEENSSPSMGVLQAVIEASAYRNYPQRPRTDYLTSSCIQLNFSVEPIVTASRAFDARISRHALYGLARHTIVTPLDIRRFEWLPEEDIFAPEFPDSNSTDRLPTADFLAIGQAITSLLRRQE